MLNKSKISIIGNDEQEILNTIQLSEVASNWLFASKFWTEVNLTAGTIFSQYEEDVVDFDTLKIIRNILSEKILGLQNNSEQIIKFSYATLKNGVRLFLEIDRHELIDELLALNNIISIAMNKGCNVLFGL